MFSVGPSGWKTVNTEFGETDRIQTPPPLKGPRGCALGPGSLLMHSRVLAPRARRSMCAQRVSTFYAFSRPAETDPPPRRDDERWRWRCALQTDRTGRATRDAHRKLLTRVRKHLCGDDARLSGAPGKWAETRDNIGGHVTRIVTVFGYRFRVRVHRVLPRETSARGRRRTSIGFSRKTCEPPHNPNIDINTIDGMFPLFNCYRLTEKENQRCLI